MHAYIKIREFKTISYIIPFSGLLTMTSISGILAQTLNGYLYIQLTIGFFLMGACAISAVSALAVELYPTQIRGMALSISLMLGRLGAMTGSNAFGPLMYSYCDYMFYIFAAIHICKYNVYNV